MGGERISIVVIVDSPGEGAYHKPYYFNHEIQHDMYEKHAIMTLFYGDLIAQLLAW